MAPRVSIAISGLTAAGKTTHAKLLASALGYEYVSAAELMLELAGLDLPVEQLWFQHSDALATARSSDELDNELDRRLVDAARRMDGVVFDSWALPWTSDAHLVRIWVESDLPSRSRKSFVSQGPAPWLTLPQCTALLEEKDAYARDDFSRRLGFDLFADKRPFDAILSNTHLIPQADRANADRGIEKFAHVMERVARGLLAGHRADRIYPEGMPLEVVSLGQKSA